MKPQKAHYIGHDTQLSYSLEMYSLKLGRIATILSPMADMNLYLPQLPTVSLLITLTRVHDLGGSVNPQPTVCEHVIRLSDLPA